MKTYSFIALLLSVLMTSGCVTGQRTVDLDVPKPGAYPATVGDVAIGEIRDLRSFENKPAHPSTPSIKGDVNRMSGEAKSLMIARQRNAYGRAMGDVALPESNSVLSISKELVTESLKRMGYRVVDSGIGDTAISIDINEFWGWSTPGMVAVSFEARVHCTLTIQGNSGVTIVTIHGYGINRGQVASDANWQLAYQRAFEDFLANAVIVLKDVSLDSGAVAIRDNSGYYE